MPVLKLLHDVSFRQPLNCRWLRSLPEDGLKRTLRDILLVLIFLSRQVNELEVSRDLFNFKTLYHITSFQILIILKRHAAFSSFSDFPSIFFEPLKRGQCALMDYNIITQQSYPGTPFDQSLSDLATRNLSILLILNTSRISA